MNRVEGISSSDLIFSVIIANHNYEAYLRQAIDSALAVDWPNIEVIVVDDGSTDGSRDIIESYGSRIAAAGVWRPPAIRRLRGRATFTRVGFWSGFFPSTIHAGMRRIRAA